MKPSTNWGSSQWVFGEFPYLSEGSLKSIGNTIARLRAEYQHKKDMRGWLKANEGIKIYIAEWRSGISLGS